MASQQHDKLIPVERYSERSYVNRSGYDAFVTKREREKSFSHRLERVESTLDRILEKLEKMNHD